MKPAQDSAVDSSHVPNCELSCKQEYQSPKLRSATTSDYPATARLRFPAVMSLVVHTTPSFDRQKHVDGPSRSRRTSLRWQARDQDSIARFWKRRRFVDSWRLIRDFLQANVSSISDRLNNSRILYSVSRGMRFRRLWNAGSEHKAALISPLQVRNLTADCDRTQSREFD